MGELEKGAGGMAMTRNELREAIKAECVAIIDLFDRKNQSYGADNEAFHNFVETARRVFGSPDLRLAFQVLLVYADKHLVALTNRGLDDPEAADRLRDIAVYALIGLAMWREMRRENAAS